MEKVEVPIHEHPLIPFTRFASTRCKGCSNSVDDYAKGDGIHTGLNVYLYGGYRCNEPECDDDFVLHKECIKPLEEINHSSHYHPLKLTILDLGWSTCSLCAGEFNIGYCCSICEFKLDLVCVRRQEPFVLPANFYGHEHPLQLVCDQRSLEGGWKICRACHVYVNQTASHYKCHECEIVIHVDCIDLYLSAYHNSHPQHPLKSLKCEVPDYADKTCLLCEEAFDGQHHLLHHCDVCNFSICRTCMKNQPPVNVECPRTLISSCT